jgi:hypothetical protein
VIENNKVINHNTTYQAGVAVPTGTPGTGDDANNGATVRNNTFCFVNPANVPVVANVPNAVVSGSTVITGASATSGTCAR